MIGFWAKNGELVEALVNRLNRFGYRSAGYTLLIEVRSRDAKNLLSLLIGLHSQSMAMPSQSRFDRGVTVTYIYCPMASQPVDPHLN